MLNKNEEVVVAIEDYSVNGEGIGKADGFPLFVKDTVLGDVVRVKVTKMQSRFGYARLMEIITPSKERIEARCPVAKQCGGCALQAMSYPAQLEFKRRKVENNLRRIGGFSDISVNSILSMSDPWRYRNKAQVPFGTDRDGRLIAGFYAGRTHSIIPCEDCCISPQENAEILSIVRRFMQEYGIKAYNEQTGKGVVRHCLIRKAFATGQIMVCIVINADRLPHADKLVTKLMAVEGMTDISLNINRRNTNVILGDALIQLEGPGYIVDRIDDLEFRISPLAFFQVNPVQTEKLYSTALSYAGLTGNEVVWDLYCGTGTISLFLARHAKHVYGVEIIPQAIDNAKQNANRNKLENADFFVGKSEEVLPQWYSEHGEKADVIVIDPPRKGCDEALLKTMLSMTPDRIVYVSCDSATLARDLRFLAEGGYTPVNVQAVDMFPHTVAVETVVLLKKAV